MSDESPDMHKPRILVEGTQLLAKNPTGIARYTQNVANALTRLGYRIEALVSSRCGFDPDHDGSIAKAFDPDAPHRPIAEKIRLEAIRLFGYAGAMQTFDITTAVHLKHSSFPEHLKLYDRVHAAPNITERATLHCHRTGRLLVLKVSSQADVLLTSRPIPLHLPGARLVASIHDIIPIRRPDTTPDDLQKHVQLIQEICRNAAHVLTVSEFSRRDIMAFANLTSDRITNVSQPVSFLEAEVDRAGEVDAEHLKSAFELVPQGYFFFAGAIEPKKNLSRLIDAHIASRTETPLVIAGGRGWMYEDVLTRIRAEETRAKHCGTTPIVRWLGRVPDHDLMTLMSYAKAFIFPSLYEGFGLPVLEAMQLGTPVITSNVSSLPEVVGDTAILVNPENVSEIAQAIQQLDQDTALRDQLGQRGRDRAAEFTTERFQMRLDEAMRTMMVEHPVKLP